MGHEMGHYVLNHQFKGLVLNGVLIVIAFGFLNWGSMRRWRAGASRGESGAPTDVAVLPLAVLLLCGTFSLCSPR